MGAVSQFHQSQAAVSSANTIFLQHSDIFQKLHPNGGGAVPRHSRYWLSKLHYRFLHK
jgi:hypothetical protein